MKKSILFFALLFLFVGYTRCEAGIGERTYHYKDTLRNRPLTVELWYPTPATAAPDNKFQPFVREITVTGAPISAGKHPLVLLSHGTGGSRTSLEWLADALVNAGYMVAAVDHWGNTTDNKIAIDFMTPWERPKDISYILTCMLKDKELNAAIDKKRIGAAGFSIGGYTILALAGADVSLDALKKFGQTPEGEKENSIPELPGLTGKIDTAAVVASYQERGRLKDPRIKAFFAMAPAIGQGFIGKSQFDTKNSDIYIVGAQSDSIAPVRTNAEHYHQLMPGSRLDIIPGKVPHYIFLEEAADVVKKEAPVYFGDDPSVDRHAIHLWVASEAVKFFNEKLK